MKKTIVVNLAVLSLSTMLMAVQMQTPASKTVDTSGVARTMTGTISDSMCGARHMEKGKSAAECTRDCVKQGTKYALLVGKKVYTLDGHEAELYKLAGERATVKGMIVGETIMVQSVASAKRMVE